MIEAMKKKKKRNYKTKKWKKKGGKQDMDETKS